MKKFFLIAFVAAFLLQISSPDQLHAQRRGLNVWAFGIGAGSTDFKEAVQGESDDLWNAWSLTFAQQNYRVDLDKPFSIGLFTGSQLDIIFPSNFEFKPYDDVLILPRIAIDVLQIGLAGGFQIFDGINVVAHAGVGGSIVATTTQWDDFNMSYFGYGITPTVGARFVLSQSITLGLGVRFGEVDTTLYFDGDKVGDTFKTDMKGYYLTISF